jgi:hypothetical protein
VGLERAKVGCGTVGTELGAKVGNVVGKEKPNVGDCNAHVIAHSPSKAPQKLFSDAQARFRPYK